MGRIALLLALGLAIGLGQSGAGTAQAQQKPTVQILLQTDLQGIPGQETILGPHNPRGRAAAPSSRRP